MGALGLQTFLNMTEYIFECSLNYLFLFDTMGTVFSSHSLPNEKFSAPKTCHSPHDSGVVSQVFE